MKSLRSKKEKKSLLTYIKNLALAMLMIYALVQFVYQQAMISDKKDEINLLQEKLKYAKEQNDDYLRLINMTDESEYLESIAIEKLGYAYPNERRFYDISRN